MPIQEQIIRIPVKARDALGYVTSTMRTVSIGGINTDYRGNVSTRLSTTDAYRRALAQSADLLRRRS